MKCNRYFEIRIGGGTIWTYAENLKEAKAKVETLYKTGCDAEYCADPLNCKKIHYHDINCRCEDCFEAERATQAND